MFDYGLKGLRGRVFRLRALRSRGLEVFRLRVSSFRAFMVGVKG